MIHLDHQHVYNSNILDSCILFELRPAGTLLINDCLKFLISGFKPENFSALAFVLGKIEIFDHEGDVTVPSLVQIKNSSSGISIVHGQ